MKLENKNVGIVFIDDFYIKDNLFYQLNKLSKIKKVNLVPILNKDNNQILQSNVFKIRKITKNNVIYYSNHEIYHSFIKMFDILIIIGFKGELLYKLNQKIIDNFVLKLIENYENENIPIVLGVKSNIDIFILFKQIKLNYNKNKYYFIPVLFPNPITKPKLISFDSSLIIKTAEYALNKKQIETIISNNYYL